MRLTRANTCLVSECLLNPVGQSHANSAVKGRERRPSVGFEVLVPPTQSVARASLHGPSALQHFLFRRAPRKLRCDVSSRKHTGLRLSSKEFPVMFVDRVQIYCQAGDGGDGCMSFRREPFEPRGGPNGGDGGHGGNVVIIAERNISSLANIVGHKHWNAERGGHGEGRLRTGKCGDDAVVLVPVGTLVKDAEHGHVLKDLSTDGEQLIVAKGGKGGRGNKHFATAIHQAPREFEPGKPGENRSVLLELKLIADVGLVGMPNAGKSTLLSRMSRATPEIANYPFTTKYPNLGQVSLGYDCQFVLADIPGLIEGAHAGIGLGHEFLRHVERTRVLVHLVEPMPMDQSNPVDNYFKIREELRLYDASLAARPEIAVVTKSELPDAAAAVELLSDAIDRPVMQISAVTGEGLDLLTQQIIAALQSLEK